MEELLSILPNGHVGEGYHPISDSPVTSFFINFSFCCISRILSKLDFPSRKLPFAMQGRYAWFIATYEEYSAFVEHAGEG